MLLVRRGKYIKLINNDKVPVRKGEIPVGWRGGEYIKAINNNNKVLGRKRGISCKEGELGAVFPVLKGKVLVSYNTI